MTQATAAVRPSGSPTRPSVSRGGRSSGERTSPRSPPRRGLLLLVCLLGAVAVWGSPYYALPLEERVRSPLHIWLRPSGYIGQGAGILSLAVMLFLWL